MKPWERIAARVIQVGSKTQIGGGVLVFSHETADTLIAAVQKYDSLSDEERRELAEANGEDFDAALSDLSPTETLRAIAPVFTTYWLVDAIDGIQGRRLPDLQNAEGDELIPCEAHYPLAAGTTGDDIRAALQARPEFRPIDATSWSWARREKPGTVDHSEPALKFETWRDDRALVLGNLRLDDNILILNVNSRQRLDRGGALLSEILGHRIGQPTVKTETVEQMMASSDAVEPRKLDIPEEEQRAIIHDHMDRHYRNVLDKPVPALDGKTPRAAVKTKSGRTKVVDWLKMMENRTAAAGDNDPMASYDFSWLWAELGIAELRR